MPKKFQSENTKAVTAKARKAEKAAEEKALKEKAAEDALWKEDDKLICKKLQRKEEKEKKKTADAQRKKEIKAMEEDEMNAITPKTAPTKVTVFQLQKQKDEQERLNAAQNKNDLTITDIPLEENVNRLEPDIISASGIDAAVAALSVNTDTTDGGPPGKRMAAAFKAFENEKLPQLKKENPTMRLSQIQQRLRKEWQRSPQNPLNQSIDQ